MKYKYGILALLGLIILVSVYFYYTKNDDGVKEGLAGDVLKQMKEANYNESQKYIKKQQTHFGARELKTLEDGAHGDTVFLKVVRISIKRIMKRVNWVLKKIILRMVLKKANTKRKLKNVSELIN